jgi:hypothetical protein
MVPGRVPVVLEARLPADIFMAPAVREAREVPARIVRPVVPAVRAALMVSARLLGLVVLAEVVRRIITAHRLMAAPVVVARLREVPVALAVRLLAHRPLINN